MATMQQLEAALVKADAAGNTDDARALAQAIGKMRSAQPETPQQEVSFDPTEGMSSPERFWAGFGKKLHDTGAGLGNLVGLVSDEYLEESERLDAPLMNTGYGKAGSVAGAVVEMAAPGGAMIKGGKYLTKVPKLAKVGNAINKAGHALAAPQSFTQTALGGAAYGFIQPGKDMKERAKNATFEAAGGTIGRAIPTVASRVIAPRVSNAVRKLTAEGVELTPGAVLGGTPQRIENAMTSVPVLGDMVNSAKLRSIESLNRAAINRALKPIGKALAKNSGVGYSAIDKAHAAISSRYDDVLSKMAIKADKTFNAEVGRLAHMAKNLPPQQAKQFQGILKASVLPKFEESGRMAGESFKDVDSTLRHLAGQYRKSQNPDHKMLGNALGELRSTMHNLARRNNPQLAQKLASTNKAYANLVRIEKASSMTGAKGGVFSPAQLNSAVKAADQSARKSATSRGQALMQDIASAAEDVIGANPVPDSGTPLRSITNLAALGGGAMVHPGVPLGLLGGGMMYSKPANRAIVKAMTQRPQALLPLGKMAEELAPYGGLLSRAAIAGGL